MPGDCFHCGLPLPPGADFSAVIDGSARPMCCAGCAAVASLIASSGLSGYYLHREAPSAVAADTGSGAAEYVIYDEPDAQSDFVAPLADGSTQVQLAIDGIHCAACAWLIEHHLRRNGSVEAINVNLAERRAAIRWNPTALPLSALMARIRALGYRPRPWIASARLDELATESRRLLRQLGVAGIVQMQIGMFAIALYAGAFDGIEPGYRDYLRWASLVLCLPVVGYSALPFFQGAWRGVRNGAPGMDLPVAVAIALAFAASAWFTLRGGGAVYYDSVAMFTFLLLLGRYLELRARHRAGLATGNALALVPAAATRLAADGSCEQIPVSRLRPGELIRVRPGEAFPADGRVREGGGSVDESSLSGESIPVSRAPGDAVSAGTLAVDGTFTVAVEATGLQSRLGTILALVDRAQQQKPLTAQLADRAASAFVLGVLALAAITGLYWGWREPERALEIVLSVLVVSCPCALSLATPTALTAATARLREQGFLVTRAHALDALADATLAIFDKTGTLTTGMVRLEAVQAVAELESARCLELAASLEALSEHPLASAFRDRGDLGVRDFRARPGEGIEGEIEGVRYRVGRADFAASGSQPPSADGRWVLLGSAGRALAWFRLGDQLREDAPSALAGLHALGLETRLLSGDSAAETSKVAEALGIGGWQGDCSPENKLNAVRAAEHGGERVLMVGDGINDVAVLAGAAVSVAVASAADVSRANADCVMLANELLRIPRAIALARRTRTVVRQNIAWAIVYNFASIPFAAAGLVPPWLAAIGMSASSLLVVANALRLRNDPQPA